MNHWVVYEAIKQHWRRTGSILTEQEIRRRCPESTTEEIYEGMIEFRIANKHY